MPELTLQNEYLRLENKILKSRLPGRIRFTDDERRSLVDAALAMGSKLMETVVNIVKPTTILAWQVARENVRLIHVLAERVQDITSMNPREDLTSTGYCLANEGQEYIVYAEQQKGFQVNGLQAGQEYRYELINIAEASIQETGRITPDGRMHRFSPPCDGAVLYLTLRDRRSAGQQLEKYL